MSKNIITLKRLICDLISVAKKTQQHFRQWMKLGIGSCFVDAFVSRFFLKFTKEVVAG